MDQMKLYLGQSVDLNIDTISVPEECLFLESENIMIPAPIVTDDQLLDDFPNGSDINQFSCSVQEDHVLSPCDTDSSATTNLGMLFSSIQPSAVSSKDDIDINNIQLYLECSEDSESSLSYSQPTNKPYQNATSQIKSDLQFKISFPAVSEDTVKFNKCSACKKIFLGKQVLREHVIKEHGKLFLMCQYCSYFSKSVKRFRTHLDTVHKDLPLTETMLNRHFRASGDEEAKAIEVHVDANNSEKSKTIESVVKEIAADKLKKKCIMVNNQQFTCEMCSFVTHAKRLLKYHCNTMHCKDRPVFKCTLCNFICKQKRTFEAHQKKHEHVFDFVCALCSKKFASKHLLTKHSRIHKGVNGATKHKCTCGSGYTASLENHNDKDFAQRLVPKCSGDMNTISAINSYCAICMSNLTAAQKHAQTQTKVHRRNLKR